MPVNSFDDYPMAWKPDKARLAAPFYQSIAGALEEDILSGALPADTRLPPQRELADFLDVNLSTITRAYKVCELKGLLYAVVGRGTFVAPNARTKNLPFHEKAPEAFIELGMIEPFYQVNATILEAARTVLERPEATRLLEYGQAAGNSHQLTAAEAWLRRFHVQARPDNLLIAAGSQNALAVSLISLFKAGDKIAVDPYTYPNFIGLASFLHIQLVAVEGDEDGMKPQALDTLCRQSGISGVYLMPSCSNPMGIVMPMERREALARVIERHGLILVEDDAYAFLLPREFRPLAAAIPDRTVYICGTSKSLCAGLRVAFLAFPEAFRAHLASGVTTINLKTVSFNAEIIAQLILDGRAEEIVERKKALAAERAAVYQRVFPHDDGRPAFFKWLPLPEGMDGDRLEQAARERGVHLLASRRFAVGARRPEAFARLAISPPQSEEELSRGLRTVKELIEEGAGARGGLDILV